MLGVRGCEERPGEFRSSQNFIGREGSKIRDARYVPPPVQEMNPALHALERFVAEPPRSIPPLVAAALIHYQFEAIHPFRDGNGRLGRLLITLWLCEKKYLIQPMLYMSAYFERSIQSYNDRLLRVSQNAEWNEWVEYFLLGVAEESLSAEKRTHKLFELHRSYRHRFQGRRSSALLLKLIENLFISPGITTRYAAELLGVTPAAAQRHIDRLVEYSILTEVTGRAKGRIYLARQIISETSA
jgi:Fic family protein